VAVPQVPVKPAEVSKSHLKNEFRERRVLPRWHHHTAAESASTSRFAVIRKRNDMPVVMIIQFKVQSSSAERGLGYLRTSSKLQVRLDLKPQPGPQVQLAQRLLLAPPVRAGQPDPRNRWQVRVGMRDVSVWAATGCAMTRRSEYGQW